MCGAKASVSSCTQTILPHEVKIEVECFKSEAFYVGKTKRRLEQRVQEHSQQGYSSLYKHSSDLCHQIDYSTGNPAVISVDNNDYRLQIKEALKIKDLKQGSKCWVPRFPQALNIFHGNSTLHLEFPAGNPAKNAGNSSYAWGIKV